jgi:hypothetical protein
VDGRSCSVSTTTTTTTTTTTNTAVYCVAPLILSPIYSQNWTSDPYWDSFIATPATPEWPSAHSATCEGRGYSSTHHHMHTFESIEVRMRDHTAARARRRCVGQPP